jgi:hypothetical protein
VYAEFNESENAARDWELSVEFYPEEQAEYEFYVTAQGQEQVRSEVPQQEVRKARVQTKRASVFVHKRMLQLAREEAEGGGTSCR